MKRPARPAPLSLRAIRSRDRAQPPPDPAPDPTPQINELARAARASWLGLLAYFSFVGVTLIGVQDADFFLPERQTQLPLIGVTIPTALFFYIAPALGAALYVYMHLYLMKLWDELAAAPPRLRGAPLSDRVLPWLVSDFALRLRGDGAVPARPLWPLAFLVTLALLFLAAPLVLGAFWWRSMPKHDWHLTILACGIPLMAALHAGAASALRLWRVTRTPGQPYAPPPRRTAAIALQALRWAPVWAAVALIGFFRTVEPLDSYAEDLNLARLGWMEPRGRDEGSWWNAAPINLAQAQLAGVVFTETPPGWLDYDQAFAAFRLDACRAEGLTPSLCGPAGEDNRASDTATLALLRSSWCARQFPAETEEPAVRCASYFNALEARIATEWRTTRETATADLPAPNLRKADLRRANLSGARLEGAVMVEARLERADLMHARLEGADLFGAGLERANLFGAAMERVDLRRASLEGAVLTQAKLEGADLRGARLESVIFWGAGLDWYTSFNETVLKDACLKAMDLSDVRISQDQVNKSFGDTSVTLPDGFARPTHWPNHILDWDDFEIEWRKWQADPAGYTPPPPPD